MIRRTMPSIVLCLFISLIGVQLSQGQEKPDKPLARDEAKLLKSPVPYTKASIARGRILYTNDCTGCHGNDGKAQVDVIADATDLTEPKLWKSGTTEGEVFRSIRDGAGISMPPYKNQIQKTEDLWHLVNYIRSLWPEDQRPKLQEEK
ncbi:MAG TPA: c-type cytochrome [Blastocatellia bacterium]|nr:c-type cytochrome [Blastocatellia bacterium]